MMNLPQFLKMIDDTTSKMTKEELAESIHHIARTLPEERRDWLVSMLSDDYIEETGTEETVPDDLYEELAKIISGEYRLDSEYNEEWDDWYASDEPDFLFEDNDDLLSVIEDAGSELHRLIACEEYEQARRIGHILLILEVQADGEYSDYNDDTLNIEDLETYDLVDFSAKLMLLDIACAVYFTSSGQERAAALYRVGTHFNHFAGWTLEELMQHSPKELPDFDAFLKDWILYLQTKEDPAADDYLDEAMEMQADPVSALETARQSVKLHPELYLKVLSLQDNVAARLETGLEALGSIDPNDIVRSEIALQTAETALKLGNAECAAYCRTEAFRSNSTAVNYLRALVNHPDYEKCLEELQSMISDYHEQHFKSFLKHNRLGESTVRFSRFLSGEFQNAYADLFMPNSSYDSGIFLQGAALISLFLYPDGAIREGGKEMLRILETALPFQAKEYVKGLGISEISDNTDMLWDCLQKCRSHTPLPDRESALDILQKHCAQYTANVMQYNLRNDYATCAAYAAVIGEIMESEGRISSKNDYLLNWKQQYSRRTAYHRELRNYGMIDRK